MDYFKHYSNASSSKLINHLIDRMGVSGYAYWFLLLELCNEHWDGKAEPKFSFHSRVVRQKLRISQAKLELFLGFCSGFSEVSFNFSENVLSLDIPKIAEVKTSRSVIKSNKKQLTVYKKRIEENRIEEEEKAVVVIEFSTDTIIQKWNDFAMRNGFDTTPLVMGKELYQDCRQALQNLSKEGKTIDDYLRTIEDSSFLKRKKGAAVTLGWIMSERNYHKIMEGKFKDANGKSAAEAYANSINLNGDQ